MSETFLNQLWQALREAETKQDMWFVYIYSNRSKWGGTRNED